MKPTERLATAHAPDGSALTLLRHDGEYTIRVNGVELMSTRRHHSEERLGELACAGLESVTGARVLIGGLGLGYTLRAVLRSVASDASVVVAELVPAVIEWNMNPEYALARDALLDARVVVREGDVMAVLRESTAAFDAIMLDVDNGADPLTTSGNAELYRDEGIRGAVAALRPGGRIAWWAAFRDEGFERALRRCGLVVETVRVSTWAGSRSRHVIHLGRPG